MNKSIRWTTEDCRPSGIIAEERHKLGPRNYNKIIQEAKKLNRKHRLDLLTAINQPDLLIVTLSEFTTVAPNITTDLQIRNLFNQFEGKGNSKKLRYLVIYLSLLEKSWLVTTLIEERLERILNSKFLRSKTLWETKMLYDLRKCLSLDQYRTLLSKIYQPSTIKDWQTLGSKILERAFLSYFDEKPIIATQRKRGYTDHGSTPSEKQRTERKILMSTENRTNAQIKEDILRKQLLLFEQNLDEILELNSLTPTTSNDYLTKRFQETIEQTNLNKKE